jgi:hypothetical protein
MRIHDSGDAVELFAGPDQKNCRAESSILVHRRDIVPDHDPVRWLKALYGEVYKENLQRIIQQERPGNVKMSVTYDL